MSPFYSEALKKKSHLHNTEFQIFITTFLLIFYSLVINALKWPAASDMLSKKSSCLPVGTISPIYFWLCHAHRFHCVNLLQLFPKWHFVRGSDLFKCLSKLCKDITFSSVCQFGVTVSSEVCHWWPSILTTYSHFIFIKWWLLLMALVQIKVVGFFS